MEGFDCSGGLGVAGRASGRRAMVDMDWIEAAAHEELDARS